MCTSKAPEALRRLDARTILDLLAKKHRDDVFVSECKTDSLKGLRLDAWVMKKAWFHPCVTGYEIKVDRSDFLQDEKWRYYLPYCNQFYFVCPKGIIAPEELEESVGLMIVASTGTRLFTKRKATYRDVDIPDEIFRYILASRARITASRDTHEENVAYWKRWLEDKDENRSIGLAVSKNLREMLQDLQSRNRTLMYEMRKYDEIKETIQELGLDPAAANKWTVKNRIKELAGEGLKAQISNVIGGLKRIQEHI